jgi:hypothetical protein
MSRRIPAGMRHISKLAAAQIQIEAALDRVYKGDYVSCITLAAAAEGIMSERKGSDMITAVSTHPKAIAKFGRKPWSDLLNMEVHYLKHATPQYPGPLSISRMEAIIMLVRAMTKLAAEEWTPKMERAKAAILLAFDEEDRNERNEV